MQQKNLNKQFNICMFVTKLKPLNFILFYFFFFVRKITSLITLESYVIISYSFIKNSFILALIKLSFETAFFSNKKQRLCEKHAFVYETKNTDKQILIIF